MEKRQNKIELKFENINKAKSKEKNKASSTSKSKDKKIFEENNKKKTNKNVKHAFQHQYEKPNVEIKQDLTNSKNQLHDLINEYQNLEKLI